MKLSEEKKTALNLIRRGMDAYKESRNLAYKYNAAEDFIKKIDEALSKAKDLTFALETAEDIKAMLDAMKGASFALKQADCIISPCKNQGLEKLEQVQFLDEHYQDIRKLLQIIKNIRLLHH